MDFFNRLIYALTELHPIHPMVVHFPIALTGAAFLFILLAYWKNNESLEVAAYANIALAALSTIAAGVTGFLDNANIYEGQAPNGMTKIILALLLFILTTGIAIVRYRNPDLFQKTNRLVYIGGYAISFFIATVLAFLGGIILYGF